MLIEEKNRLVQGLFNRVSQEWLPSVDKATVAFYVVGEKGIAHDRTGVLLRIADSYFILTASHWLRGYVDSGIPISIAMSPENAVPELLIDTDDPVLFLTTEKNCRDVAAIRLPSPVVERLKKEFSFISLREVELNPISSDAFFVAFGYPCDWSKDSAAGVPARPLVYSCSLYKGDPNPNGIYDPRLHVLFNYEIENNFNILTGEALDAPNVHGMSGCGIWKICDLSEEMIERWKPQDCKLIAIQNRWSPDRNYIQGTMIKYAVDRITDEYPELAPARELVYPNWT